MTARTTQKKNAATLEKATATYFTGGRRSGLNHPQKAPEKGVGSFLLGLMRGDKDLRARGEFFYVALDLV